MDNNNFFLFSDKDLRGAINLVPSENIDCLKLFRGEIEPTEPILFQKNYGSKIYDLIHTGCAGLYLISERLVNLLIDNEITGWKTYPCHVKNIKGYSIFSVIGRCEGIDYTRSKKFIKQPYIKTGIPIDALKGLYFEESSWDESDVFTPANTSFTFITKKTKKIIEDNMITNVKIENLKDIEII